jgi:hypothetical protein
VSGLEVRAAGQFDVAHRPHRRCRQAQGVVQQRLQLRGLRGIKTRDARHQRPWPTHLCRQRTQRVQHLRGRSRQLRTRNRRGRALGADPAVAIGQRPAGLGAAGVQAEETGFFG